MEKMDRSRQVVFLDTSTFPTDIALPELQFAHNLVVHDKTSPDQVADRIANADIVVTNKVTLSGEAIAHAKRLKLIAIAATGYDVVDLAACAAQGITVSNIRNYAVNTVPEHTFALILALRRSITAYRQSVAAGDWQKSDQFCYFDYPIQDLAGSTMGIVGDGVLGKAVADIARAFGMRVLFSTYKGVQGMGPLYTPFEDVLRRSDIITLHSPLMPATRNMIGRAEFAVMEKRPLLINTARGGLVDEHALFDALTSGQIAGAGFDVVTTEPPAADHVMMKLLAEPNFILTPHVAWASRQAIEGLLAQLIENIELFVRGEPRNIVLAS